MATTSRDAFLADSIWQSITRSFRLSQREAQVVQLLLADATEATMAATLSISPHTVHTHLERIYRKLHVTSRCQVVIAVFQRYVELTAPTASASSTATRV